MPTSKAEAAADASRASSALDTEHLKRNLRAKSVRGGAVTLTAQAMKYVLQVVSTIVLARLLTPRDFGLVAMVTALTGVVSMFAEAGLSDATVQREEINHAQLNTVFWVNAGLGVVLMVITAACAPLVADFYKEPKLVGITVVTAVSFLFAGLTVQHSALLRRQMRYRAIAVRDVGSFAASVVIALVMAWYGAGYWSLVALTWIYSLGQFIASWFMVKWRPGLPRRAEGVRSLLAFGGNLTGSGFISYLQRNFDNVLVGWYWGAVPLGLYSRAYSLLTLPLRQLNYPMSGVAISAMSRLQDDPERQARYYLRASNLIMWLSAPLTGFVFVAAEPLIVLTLGPKWRDAAPVFQLLAISALFQPVYNATGWLFVSRGRVDRLFKLTIYTCPIIIGSFVLGLPFGIRGVAMSYSLILLAILPWIFKYTFEGTALNLRRFGKVLVLPLSVAVMAILAGMASMHLVRFHGDILRIAVAGGAFAAVYAASLLLPPVRKEINSLTALIRELRPQRATTAS